MKSEMQKKNSPVGSMLVGILSLLPVSLAAQQIDRTVLPIKEPTYPESTVLDVRDAKAPPRFEVKAPAKAPNVVIVLLDDVGFAASSAFGGPINMPTLDKLAADGLRYNRFHTTALCSPTRTALLTGRNHHVNNAGAIMELATAFPGNTGIRPNNVAPLAEMLRMNGYSTAAFGKYHETPPWESQTPDQKKLGARQMETFAGFAEHTDHEVGRLVQALEDMGAMDNTLLIYIVGDNGASAEGGPEGAYNEMMALNGIISNAAINMPHLNEWGGPSTFPHYAIGWAWAGDTPFQWTKQIASHFGGTRNGMVMHWPKRIKSKGEIRSQFTHVTDIAPTVLEATD